MKETKRYVLLIARFSDGKNLLDILEQAAVPAQEKNFKDYIEQSLGKSISILNLSIAGSVNDLSGPGELSPQGPIYRGEDGEEYFIISL